MFIYKYFHTHDIPFDNFQTRNLSHELKATLRGIHRNKLVFDQEDEVPSQRTIPVKQFK